MTYRFIDPRFHPERRAVGATKDLNCDVAWIPMFDGFFPGD
jgi:hypothetical protein